MAGKTGMTKEALVKQNEQLSRENAELKGQQMYVGIRHLTNNPIAAIRPFGAKDDGTEDVVFKGYGDGQAVPADKWQKMVEDKDSDVMNGFFVRDDSIVADLSTTKKIQSFGEDKIPNAILDSGIEKLFAGTDAAFKKRLSGITEFFVLSRFDRIGKEQEDAYSKIELISKHREKMIHDYFFPEGFEKMDCKALMLVASKHNITFQKQEYVDLDVPPDELESQTERVRSKMRRVLKVKEEAEINRKW